MEQHGGGQFYNSVFSNKNIIVIFHFALEFIDILLHHCSKKIKKWCLIIESYPFLAFCDFIFQIFQVC